MPILLSEKKEPGPCTVKSISGDKASRLMEMGLLPGTPIQVIRSAPLGFPIEIKLRGYSLSLREAEAKSIEIVT